jgi:hypothetical protein
MTRAERKAMNAAIQARVAIRVFAKMAAKRAVQAQIRAKGERISDYSNKELILRAEAWLETHPELIVEARANAARMGYC